MALGLRVTSDDLQLAGGQRRLGQGVLLLLGGHSGHAAVLEGFRAPDHHGEVLGELGVPLGALQLVPLLLLHPDPSAKVHLQGRTRAKHSQCCCVAGIRSVCISSSSSVPNKRANNVMLLRLQ